MESRNVGGLLMAFFVGGIIGAGAAILFAPASGKETRRKLKEMEEDALSKTADLLMAGKEKIAHEKVRLEHTLAAGAKAFKDA